MTFNPALKPKFCTVLLKYPSSPLAQRPRFSRKSDSALCSPLRNPSRVLSDDFGDKTPGSCERDSQSLTGPYCCIPGRKFVGQMKAGDLVSPLLLFLHLLRTWWWTDTNTNLGAGAWATSKRNAEGGKKMYESFRPKTQVLNSNKHTNNSFQAQVAQTSKIYLHRNVFKSKNNL